MIDKRMLAEYAAALGLPLGEAELERFDRYAELLVEWNERMNLTAITEPGEIVVKHFVDSLTLLRAFTPPVGATLVDVGTGAGFPSVPVKIVRPDLRVTLLDSLNKRLVFLRELSGALGQEENVCVHARAEEAGRQPGHREQYALATARAVAHLRELSEYCLPLVRVGGMVRGAQGGRRGHGAGGIPQGGGASGRENRPDRTAGSAGWKPQDDYLRQENIADLDKISTSARENGKKSAGLMSQAGGFCFFLRPKFLEIRNISWYHLVKDKRKDVKCHEVFKTAHGQPGRPAGCQRDHLEPLPAAQAV